MARLSQTVLVGIASTAIPALTDNAGFISATNIGANNVWYPLLNTAAAASVEGAEMGVIQPGKTKIIPWSNAGGFMIAETAATKVHFESGTGQLGN